MMPRILRDFSIGRWIPPLLCTLLWCTLLFVAGPSLSSASDTTERTTGRLRLVQEHKALQLERDLIRERPDQPYLILDLQEPIVTLKSGGRILRSISPSRVRAGEPLAGVPRVLELISLIQPVTPEAGSEGLRLRGRKFPLDFRTRLVEGPRDRTRFYFEPTLLIGATEPGSDAIDVGLPEEDIKALSSALDPGFKAILIPRNGTYPSSEARQ